MELSTRRRNKLRKTQFGLPGSRKYPMPDRVHAANAKARARQQLNRGKLSRSSYNKIVAKANKVLARGSKRGTKRRSARRRR